MPDATSSPFDKEDRPSADPLPPVPASRSTPPVPGGTILGTWVLFFCFLFLLILLLLEALAWLPRWFAR